MRMAAKNGLRPVSIDPAGARDLDDAVAAARLDDGGWLVEVRIPDVPTALTAGTSQDIAARQAGVTTYATNAIRRPMLPLGMIHDLSLSPTRDTPAIRIMLKLEPDLTVARVEVDRIRDRTTAALTYAQADAALVDEAHPLHSDLAALADLAARLHEDRSARTGAVFDAERMVFTDEEGAMVGMDEVRAHRSNLTVMEIMILTNAALARHSRENGFAVLYRNHRLDGCTRGDRASSAHEIARRDGIGARAAEARMRTLSHMVGKAEMGVDPLGHHGLDLDCYAWFTSPLRRYADVANLRALADAHRDGKLEHLAGHLTTVHREAKASSAEHHGGTSRRRMIQALVDGNGGSAARTPVHVIMRAIAENGKALHPPVTRHIARRMAEDKLGGRDIAALIDGASLLGPDAPATVEAWVAAEPGRAMLLADHRAEAGKDQAGGGNTTAAHVPAAPRPKENRKGRLLEMATAAGATATFSPARRTGPPHAPVFAVTATWTSNGQQQKAEGRERTLKGAEHAAAGEMLAILGGARDEVAPTAKGASKAGVAPKTALLELAAREGARLVFGDVVTNGPDHRRRFTATVTWRTVKGDVTATGDGGAKRDAERDACEQVLAMIREPTRHP